MRLHVWQMFFEGDWNHQAEIEEVFFLKNEGRLKSFTQKNLFGKYPSRFSYADQRISIQPGIFETFSPPFFALLAVTSGFIASRTLSCRYLAKKVFCGCMYTTQNNSGSMMWSMPLWFYACFIMFLSCSLHVLPIRLHPGEAMVPTATCGASSLQPPGPSPIATWSATAATRTRRARTLRRAAVHASRWVMGNPWGKTEKSGEKWVKRRC